MTPEEYEATCDALRKSRTIEAMSNATRAATHIGDGGLIEARNELKEALQSVGRLIESLE